MTSDEKEALTFLYAYMPIGDITDYNGQFYLDNIRSSFLARVEMPWGDSIPEDIFRHFVLPVRINNENLDESRMIFYNELRDRVEMPHLKVNVGFTDPNWPDYGYELSPLLYEIRRERAVELVGEGFRWDDIVRWKAGKLLEAPKSMLGMKVSDKLKEQYDSFSRELTQDNLLIVYPDRTTRLSLIHI